MRRVVLRVATWSAVTLVPGTILLVVAEANRDDGRFSVADRTPEHAIGALLAGLWLAGMIVIAQPVRWVVRSVLLGWTLLTALPGIGLLLAEGSGDLVALDYSPYGEILIGAWIVGLGVLSALARATRPAL